MVQGSLAGNPLALVLFWLTFWAWVALWLGIVRRDRGTDVRPSTDQGSRALIGITFWSGVLGAFLAAWMVPAAQLPGSEWSILLGGLVLMWGGMALRLWAVQTLGRLFRTVVVLQDHHRLISDGPYRLIRHPSYAGSLLTLAGLSLALGNWLSLLVAVLCPLVGFTRRIRIEEATMQARFGDDYTAYARRTWHLLPWLW
ncbi:MAG: isoprenylcysteine carboxylmethyltransferase family protein [Candidatus Tectimicrobiota bacterium]